MNMMEKIGKTYTLKRDLVPIMLGKVPLPNFRNCSLTGIAACVAENGSRILGRGGYANYSGQKLKSYYFLVPPDKGSALEGHFDGRGYVVMRDKHVLVTGQFAICDHQYGGKPSHCRFCGMLEEVTP